MSQQPRPRVEDRRVTPGRMPPPRPENTDLSPTQPTDTEEAALRIASSRNLARLKSVTGRARGVPTIEEALAYEYAPNEVAYTQQYTRLCVDGAPEQVKERLDELAKMYQTQDLSIVTICYAFADRVRSYELVAQVCGLEKRPDCC